jgi:hypothetical protein
LKDIVQFLVRDENPEDKNSLSKYNTRATMLERLRNCEKPLATYFQSKDDEDESVERFGFDDDLEEDEDQEVETDLKKLTVKQLKVKLIERGLKQHGNKTELIERLLNPQPSDYKKKPKAEGWRTSKAKALLIRLLRDRRLESKSPEEVWESHEWFKQYPKERFVTNMKNLIDALNVRDEIVQNDNATIEAELARIAALRITDANDPPMWHRHPTVGKLLEEDIKNGRHKSMPPAEFQKTRDEYLLFDKRVFRKHIYQEERKQREMPMKVAKRNKLAERKHKDMVDEEVARWHADQNFDDDVNEMYDLEQSE